jgi:methionyl-tRNA formyltransferase
MDTPASADQPLRIVLFVREPFALAGALQTIRELGHRVVAVLTSAGPPTRRSDGYQTIVQQTPKNIDVIVSNFPARWAALIAPYAPDLIVIATFSWKVPPDVLAIPRIGTINLHGAMLPNYRGRGDYALQTMFRNDDRHGYGATWHWVDDDFDTGPILAQQIVPIEDDDDVMSLVGKLVTASIATMPRAISMAASGEPGTPQRDQGFYCGPLDPAWQTIDWNAPAREIHNQVRAWFLTGAYATIDEMEARITRTRLVAGNADATPGTVLSRDNGTLIVQCGDGPIQILEYAERA